MKVDLSKDQNKVRKFILRRIKEYDLYENFGPGDDEDPIRLITLGFYAAQGGYVSLVFDTRKDAEVDGEWTQYLDETTMLNFSKWSDFYERVCDGKSANLIKHDGKSENTQFQIVDEDELINEKSEKLINAYFGTMLSDLMIDLRENESFSGLPLEKDAFFVIEEFDGNFFWPTYRSRKSKGRILSKK